MPRKLPPIPPKYLTYGLAILVPIVQYGVKALIRSFQPDPRTCPKCSYKMVSQVGRRGVKTKEGKPEIHNYWRCSACAARYRSQGDGPFHHVAEDEWKKYVRLVFRR